MLQKIKFTLLSSYSKFRKLIFGNYATSVIYNSENGQLALPIEDFAIGRKLGFKGKWDLDEIKFILENIHNNDIIYIIGTHVGALLIPLSKKSKRIVGFEANPTTFNYLKTNIFLNSVNNVDIFNYAVGDKIGTLDFFQNKVNSGGSKIVPKKKNFSFEYDTPNKIEVSMVPLDEFINQHHLPDPNLLIVDIEGAEYIALQGMQKSLNKCNYLYIEYEPNHLKYVANCSLEDFFQLFIDTFVNVTFMRKRITINLINEKDKFYNIVTDMYNHNISDDLFLSKEVFQVN